MAPLKIIYIRNVIQCKTQFSNCSAFDKTKKVKYKISVKYSETNLETWGSLQSKEGYSLGKQDTVKIL